MTQNIQLSSPFSFPGEIPKWDAHFRLTCTFTITEFFWSCRKCYKTRYSLEKGRGSPSERYCSPSYLLASTRIIQFHLLPFLELASSRAYQSPQVSYFLSVVPLQELFSREKSASLYNLVLSREAAWLLVSNQEESKADFLRDLLQCCCFSSALPEPFASCSLSEPLPRAATHSSDCPGFQMQGVLRAPAGFSRARYHGSLRCSGNPNHSSDVYGSSVSLGQARPGSFANHFSELCLHKPSGESTREDYYTAALALEQESRIRERRQDVNPSSPGAPRYDNPLPRRRAPGTAPSPFTHRDPSAGHRKASPPAAVLRSAALSSAAPRRPPDLPAVALRSAGTAPAL